MAKKKANNTVKVITNANVEKNTKLAKYKKNPQKNVVIHPLKMLTPISLKDYFIFNALVGYDECIKSVLKCKT